MDQRQNLFNNCVSITAKKIFNEFPNRTAKKFGQNFLFDEKINRKIVSAAGDLGNKTIVEIGPGPGGLTLEILKQDIKKLYIIELDPHWASVWRKLKYPFDDKLEVIECDALKFDLKVISPDVIISNLPYNVSTQLLFKWLDDFDLYEQLILMFQKEVADRLYAKPCTKAYGKLSVLTQWKSEVIKEFDLEPGSFYPTPKVKSTIVKFIPFKKTEHYRAEISTLFSELLTSVFMHRRKIISKPMAKFTKNPEKVLTELGYNKNTRAEEISVSNYIKILDILKQEIF